MDEERVKTQMLVNDLYDFEQEQQICLAHGMSREEVEEIAAFAVKYPATRPERITPADIIRMVRHRYDREGKRIVGDLERIYRDEVPRQSHPRLFQ